MRFPFDLIDEKWRALLQSQLEPPLSTIDDFLQRDHFQIIKQLHCKLEDVLFIKRQLLESVSFQLPRKRRVDEIHATDSTQLSKQPLLDIFDSSFPSLSSIPSASIPITTGLDNINSLFHGGIPRGQVTCFAGETASGRTQVCLHVALSAALYQNVRVLYIDTNLQVSARRLHSMLSSMILERERRQHPAQQNPVLDEALSEQMTLALGRIDIQRCFSLFDGLTALTILLDRQQQAFKSDSDSIGYDLIIIDSLYHWVAPLLSDQNEKFPSSGTFTTATTSSGRPSLSGSSSAQSLATAVNIHPYIARFGLLLRALASSHIARTQIYPAIITTTLSTWLTPVPDFGHGASSSLYRSETGGSSTGSRTSIHGYNRAFASYWRDLFDSVLICHNSSLPTSLPPALSSGRSSSALWQAPPTTVHIRVIHRPPYFKAQPEAASITFPVF